MRIVADVNDGNDAGEAMEMTLAKTMRMVAGEKRWEWCWRKKMGRVAGEAMKMMLAS